MEKIADITPILEGVIPVCEPDIQISDVAAVTECMRTTWISGFAPVVAEFEKAFAAYVGAGYGIACNSGTTALQLALDALGVGPGDEVIMPDLTMIACANACRYLSAKPVFVDIDPETWCIDPKLIPAKITSKTKAIMPVHLYGHPADLDIIAQSVLSNSVNGAAVIEDAAEAIGTEYKGKIVGALGDVGCFSFFANKNITTGEGGMVVAGSKELAERMRSLRSHAFGTGWSHFLHSRLAYSYRMSGLEAALGLSQTERIEKLVEKKRSNARFYNTLLKPLADAGKLTLPPEKPYAKSTYWMYTILVEPSFGMSRNDLMLRLWNDHKVETRTAFIPLHLQPAYRDIHDPDDYSVSIDVASKGINLPSSTTLKPEQIMMICEAITKAAT